ncbi:MAG: hypothetical protein ACE5KV_07575 [Thermoplasmata archaeon]
MDCYIDLNGQLEVAKEDFELLKKEREQVGLLMEVEGEDIPLRALAFHILPTFDLSVWKLIISKGYIGTLDPYLARELQRFYYHLSEVSNALEERNELAKGLTVGELEHPAIGLAKLENMQLALEYLVTRLPEIRGIGLWLASALHRPLSSLGVRDTGYVIRARIIKADNNAKVNTREPEMTT